MQRLAIGDILRVTNDLPLRVTQQGKTSLEDSPRVEHPQAVLLAIELAANLLERAVAPALEALGELVDLPVSGLCGA